MAFIQLEDVFGSIEVVIFPNSFEKYETILQEDSKIFIKGRVNVAEETAAKLICETVIAFEDMPKKVWIQYPNLEAYQQQVEELLHTLSDFKGNHSVTIYLSEQKAKKTLPAHYNVTVTADFLTTMYKMCGKDNVKVVDIPIENQRKM
jgi:DNA polymerase-3 subunit alpha